MLDWCEALLAAGDVGPAADAIVELDRLAADSERLRAWHTCFAGQLTVLTAPEALHATADQVGAAALELARLEDAAGEAKAHFVHAQALARLGKVGACEAALDQALAAARRAGDRRRANAVLAGAPLAALWGPSPVTRASGRCLDVVRVLRITQGAPAVEAVALSCQGVLEALRGRTEAARRMLASSRTMVEELGISHRLHETDVFAGRIDLLEGDVPAAERNLRAGYEGLRDLGLGIDAARAAALLGRALLAQDRAAEAEALSHESELLAGDDLQAAIAWRGVRAEALARRGDHATAIGFAEAAVAIAAATDALLDHADARLALAAALRAAGRVGEADQEERRAIELWEAKGATVLAERAHRVGPATMPDGSASAPRAVPVTRPVRPNFATEEARRLDAAVAARDVEALSRVWREDVKNIDHVHGRSYGHAESVERQRSMIEDSVEPAIHVLHVFDGDGLITQTELFEPEREAEARARFNALTADAASQPAAPRRLRPNAATATAARFDAAIAARDESALAAVLADGLTAVDHPNGAVYGRDGVFVSFQRLLRMDGPTMCHEPLATLGESLALFRRRIGASGGRLDVGPYEREEICVAEVDADGRFRHHENFAAERLGTSLVRLYERSAEGMPEGPARTRASGVARALAAYDGPIEFDRLALAAVPSFEAVDHRILGTWSAQGREEWLTHWRGQLGLAADSRGCVDDVLALEPAAILVRDSFFGSSRMSGGGFEVLTLLLHVFDTDGRIARSEIFDPDREAEALARFDVLTAGAAPTPPVRHRVRLPRALRANAAAATSLAIADAFAHRDLAAIDALLGDPMETIEHPTGTTYGRAGALESSRRMMPMPDLDFRIEPLATLGDALVLARRTVAASGTAGGRFDVGAYEIESIILNGVDAAGRLAFSEVFAPDHLGGAIVRIYERHAELLPAGPSRIRAAAVAQAAAAAHQFGADPDRFVAALAPSIVAVDDCTVGFGTIRGKDAVAAAVRALHDLSEDVTSQYDEVLALSEQAVLVRITQRGRFRSGGGEWERWLCSLRVHGADGLIVYWEIFEGDQEATALTRYDALVKSAGEATPAPAAHPFANAATRNLDRFVRATADRDWVALADRFSPSLRFDDRRPLLRMQLPQDGFLEQHRVLFDAPNARWSTTTIATRGERLALARLLFHADVAGGGGALEIDHRVVLEVGVDGRSDGVVLFEPADLDAAYAELDARWWAREETAHVRAAAYQAAFSRALARRDWARLAGLHAPTLVAHDHRLVGWDVLHGPSAYVGAMRAMVDLAPDAVGRLDHLRPSEHGFIAEVVWAGTRDGGAFESPFLWVVELDAAGLARRLDFYDPRRSDAAWARFEELGADRATSPAG